MVSVVITTYNRANLLKERSLPSVLRQTYKDFECVILDDCSKDNTEEVVKEFQKKDSRIRYVKLKENKGHGGARNAGVDNSKGEFLVFLDDDNEFLPNFLEETVPVLEKLPPEFGAVTAAMIMVTKHLQYRNAPSLNGSFYTSIYDGWLFRKSIFQHLSYDERLYSDEDADFGINFFQKYKAEILQKSLWCKYDDVREAGGIIYQSYSLPSPKRLKSLDIFFDKHITTFQKLGSKNDLEFLYRFCGSNWCLAGQMQKGRNLLRQACLIKPTYKNIPAFLASYFGHKLYLIYNNLSINLNLFLKMLFSKR